MRHDLASRFGDQEAASSRGRARPGATGVGVASAIGGNRFPDRLHGEGHRPAQGARSLETRKRTPHVAVVGAGIAGIGVAIELAMRGCTVDLYEKTDRVHGEASLANEGKIHLGYIYANDPTQRTARQMVEGAWSFSPILREWLEGAIADTSRSTGFDYLVHRDSLRSPDELAITYAQIAELNCEAAQRSDASYFGLAAERPPRLLSRQRLEAEYGPDVLAAFETPEIAVDTEVIGAALARRISADPRIRLHLGAEVLAASRRDGMLTLEVRQDDETRAATVRPCRQRQLGGPPAHRRVGRPRRTARIELSLALGRSRPGSARGTGRRFGIGRTRWLRRHRRVRGWRYLLLVVPLRSPRHGHRPAPAGQLVAGGPTPSMPRTSRPVRSTPCGLSCPRSTMFPRGRWLLRPCLPGSCTPAARRISTTLGVGCTSATPSVPGRWDVPLPRHGQVHDGSLVRSPAGTANWR